MTGVATGTAPLLDVATAEGAVVGLDTLLLTAVGAGAAEVGGGILLRPNVTVFPLLFSLPLVFGREGVLFSSDGVLFNAFAVGTAVGVAAEVVGNGAPRLTARAPPFAEPTRPSNPGGPVLDAKLAAMNC